MSTKEIQTCIPESFESATSEMVGIKLNYVPNAKIIMLNSKSSAKEENNDDGGYKTLNTVSELEKFLTDPNNTVPIYPLLIPIAGLLLTGKTRSLEKAFEVKAEADMNFQHHEFVFSMFQKEDKAAILHVGKDCSFQYGMQSGLQYNCIKLSLICNQPSAIIIKDEHCKSFLENTVQLLSGKKPSTQKIESDANSPNNTDKSDITCDQTMLTHGIGFLNMWDTSINNKTVRPVLECFGRFFTRSILWLFIDLDEDLDNLHLPPKGTDKYAIGFRSQIVYLLRQCQLCKYSQYLSKEHNNHKVCTIFATYSTSTDDPQEKRKKLQIECEEAASQMNVDELIDFNIILVDTDNKRARPIKMQLIKELQKIQPKKVPLCWLLLRGALANCDGICIRSDELEKLAEVCGLPKSIESEHNLEKFCDFFSSFGSILDLRKIDNSSKYIIVKPYEFLSLCDKTLKEVRHEDGVIDISQQTQKNQICIELMLSTGIGVKLKTTHKCYFTAIRPEIKTRNINRGAVQFVMSMASPSIQKPASIIEALQKHLKRAEIHPSLTLEWNSIVISTQNELDQKEVFIFLSFQGDVVEVSLWENGGTEVPAVAVLQQIVKKIVQAFHEAVSKRSKQLNDIHYHFAIRCQQNDDDSVTYNYPYHKRHVLPKTNFCEQCIKDEINSQPFIKAWITALHEDDVPPDLKLNGDLFPQDVTKVVEEVSKYPTEAICLLSKELGVEEYFNEQKNSQSNMWLVLGMLHLWQSQLNKDDESPRKVLARHLVAADAEWNKRNEPNFGKLAQRIDMQVLTEHQKQILKKRKQ